MGVIQYHLNSLEKDRKIVSRRRGVYRLFYPSLVFGENQLEILNVLSQETARDLLLYLIKNPDAIQKQLSEYANISAGNINWHMRRLEQTGIVSARREGQFVKYRVEGNQEEILKLLQSYHPTVWERWADRIANTISDIPPRKEEEKGAPEEKGGGEQAK